MYLNPAPLLDIELSAPSHTFEKVGKWFELPDDFDNSGLLHVDYELSLIYGYLHFHKTSQATQKNYAKELEKFVQWAWRIKGISLLKIRREDASEYVEFLRKPPINWIGRSAQPKYRKKNGERILNNKWRPFSAKEPSEYKLSDNSLSLAITILQGFYKWLIEDQITDLNPITLLPQKKTLVGTNTADTEIRRISNLQWDYTLRAANELAQKEPRVNERSLFVITIMYTMYVRISDLAPYGSMIPRMNNFRTDSDRNWWFIAKGKGNKTRKIAVSDDTLRAFKRYRESLGLAALPSPKDDSYLFPSLRKPSAKHDSEVVKGYLSTTRQFQRMLEPIFDMAYDQMVEDGLVDEALELKDVSAHWMRHTGISEDIKVRSREHVREDAGHSSFQTTDKYIDVETRERHASAKHKKVTNI